jgi:hypothetical protein
MSYADLYNGNLELSYLTTQKLFVNGVEIPQQLPSQIPTQILGLEVGSVATQTSTIGIAVGAGITDVLTNISTIFIPSAPVPPSAVPSYGSFYSSTIQVLPSSIAYGVYHDDSYFPILNSVVPDGAYPTSTLKVLEDGVYKVAFSCQIDKQSGGGSSAEVDFYASVNGNALPQSATKYNISNTEELATFIEYFIPMNSNDVVSCVGYTAGSNVRVLAVPANPPVPAIPSIITNIQKIA